MTDASSNPSEKESRATFMLMPVFMLIAHVHIHVHTFSHDVHVHVTRLRDCAFWVRFELAAVYGGQRVQCCILPSITCFCALL